MATLLQTAKVAGVEVEGTLQRKTAAQREIATPRKIVSGDYSV
jgi:hypothetical protein